MENITATQEEEPARNSSSSAFRQFLERHRENPSETLKGLTISTGDFGYSIYSCATKSLALEFIPFLFIAGIDSKSTPSRFTTKPLSAIAASSAFGPCVVSDKLKYIALTSDLSDENKANAVIAISALQTGAKYIARSYAFDRYNNLPTDKVVSGFKLIKGTLNGLAYAGPLVIGFSGASIYAAPAIETIDNMLNIAMYWKKPTADYSFKNDAIEGLKVGLYVLTMVHYLGPILAHSIYKFLVESTYNNLCKIKSDIETLFDIGLEAATTIKDAAIDSFDYLSKTINTLLSPTTQVAGDQSDGVSEQNTDL